MPRVTTNIDERIIRAADSFDKFDILELSPPLSVDVSPWLTAADMKVENKMAKKRPQPAQQKLQPLNIQGQTHSIPSKYALHEQGAPVRPASPRKGDVATVTQAIQLV